MNNRIKELRKALGLTQQEFADRIRVDRSTITGYETGKAVPNNAIVSLICQEFKVNETWLRDGVGEMAQKKSRDDELMEFFGNVLEDKPDEFRRKLVRVLSRLDVKEWALLEQMAAKLAEETEKADPED